VNSLIVEAVTDLGELGKGTIQFAPGKGRGLKSVRFPSPKHLEAAPAAGRQAAIHQTAKNQPAYTTVDLQALYTTSGGLLRTSHLLCFKDTIKLDLAKVQKLTSAGTGGLDFDVTLKSGQQSPLVLLERFKSEDDKTDMQIEGLVGRFAGGYRFFPMATVGELVFEDKNQRNSLP
jgi:hypothetical protein